MTKEYVIGKGCTFITDNRETIERIEKAEVEILKKAEENDDKKMVKYYDRIKNDEEYRKRKVAIYVLKGMV